jgi:hypothetical protein
MNNLTEPIVEISIPEIVGDSIGMEKWALQEIDQRQMRIGTAYCIKRASETSTLTLKRIPMAYSDAVYLREMVEELEDEIRLAKTAENKQKLARVGQFHAKLRKAIFAAINSRSRGE